MVQTLMKNPRGHQKTVKVKTAKKRTSSSTRWLERQLNDPYVAQAKKLGYRSRATFKLLQLDEKLNLLKPGLRAVDLGCAPGGWVQVMIDKIQPQKTGGRVVGIDYLEMQPFEEATILQKDFTEPDAPDLLKAALGGKADLVVSDMAAPTTGHKRTDHLRIIALSELAYYFARDVLNEGGAFLTKVFQGGSTHELLTLLKKEFKTIKHIKPDASRSDSAEIYVVAQGFKGKDESLYPETYDEDDFYP